MSVDRKMLLAGLLIAMLSACAEPPESASGQAPTRLAKAPIPNVDYYLPPAYTTRDNTSTVPIGSALCPTLVRFGSPTSFGSGVPGCSFR